MLIKRKDAGSTRRTLQFTTADSQPTGMDRRTFLRRSGLTTGALAAVGAINAGSIKKAKAISPPEFGVPIVLKKNICTHCSVGCTVHAEVQNGVWTGQEPAFESLHQSRCALRQGAAIRRSSMATAG